MEEGDVGEAGEADVVVVDEVVDEVVDVVVDAGEAVLLGTMTRQRERHSDPVDSEGEAVEGRERLGMRT